MLYVLYYSAVRKLVYAIVVSDMAGGPASFTRPGLWEYSSLNISTPPVLQLPRAAAAASGRIPAGYEAKAALLLKRVLSNMATCSQQSRKVLVVLRRQLGASLEEQKLTPSTAAGDNDSSNDYSAIVNCRNCEGFMVQPVCLPCGHSICKSCTEKSNVVSSDRLTCPSCSQVCSKIPCDECVVSDTSSAGAQRESCRVPTVIIQNAFRKWYPDWVESCRFREEGNIYANRGNFTSAVQCYSEALQNGVYCLYGGLVLVFFNWI